jgi:hypothetical protein
MPIELMVSSDGYAKSPQLQLIGAMNAIASKGQVFADECTGSKASSFFVARRSATAASPASYYGTKSGLRSRMIGAIGEWAVSVEPAGNCSVVDLPV